MVLASSPLRDIDSGRRAAEVAPVTIKTAKHGCRHRHGRLNRRVFMLNFGALPPEINSGLMYLGPGSAPMIAAASAWNTVAVELSIAATGYGSVLSELAGSVWFGATSQLMAAATTPYVIWLHDTATRAAQTAGQATAAIAAYELAFATTVPPPVIAANRSLLLSLIAANIFGQNAPAIAATELQYAEMWLQDAVAMYRYAESSAAASTLTMFTTPAPSTAQLLGAPGTAGGSLPSSTLVATAFSATKIVNTVMSTSSSAVSGRGILIQDARLASPAERDAEDAAALQLVSAPRTGWGGSPAAPMVASTGRAGAVGRLSVPPGWAALTPRSEPVALASSGSAINAGPLSAAGYPPTPGTVFSQSALGMLSHRGADPPRARSKPVIVRSPAAG